MWGTVQLIWQSHFCRAKKMKKISYGLPLLFLTAATSVSWAGGKKLHAAFGAALLGMSVLHALQHRKKLAADAVKGVGELGFLEMLSFPQSRLEAIVRAVDVASYLPGRIRLRSRQIIGNESLCQQVRQELGAFSELDTVEVNGITGSILIEYEPMQLRKNEQLARIERYIIKQMKGR